MISESASTDQAPKPSTYRPDIQGLRALAVILVVMFHAGVPHLGGGFIGVDVFFVISGYVITALLLRQPERPLSANLASFYSHRIRRIVPAATVVLIATVVATYYWLGANTGLGLLTDVRWASLFAANWHFIAINSGYLIPGVSPSLVTHYWSLAVEEQFYIVYPLLVFGIGRLLPREYVRPVLAAVLVSAIVSSSWWSIHLTRINSVEAFYSPFTRFWELALGGVLVIIPASWATRTPRLNAIAGTFAIEIIIFEAWRLNGTTGFPGATAWWPCGAAAVLLWTGQCSAVGGPSSWLSWRPIRYIGDVSYSFYLWHFVWLMLPLQYATTPMSPWSRVGQVLAAFACASMSYHFLENPIRRSKWLDRDYFAVAMLLLSCLLLTWNITLLYRLL